MSADKLAGMEGKGQTEMRGWLLARSVVDYEYSLHSKLDTGVDKLT